MSVQPPIAPELWQQIPPPAQSALLEAWEQAQRRCQSLEEQLRQLRDRPDRKDILPSFTPPSLPPLDKPNPTPPAHDTKLSRSRHRRHHRNPREYRKRRREEIVETLKRYLFWPLLVVVAFLLMWGLLQIINPGGAPALRGR